MNLNQVTIPSINVRTAAGFYEKLGLKLIVNAQPKYVRFLCPDGESTLSIHQVDALPEGPGIYLYFENEQLDELVRLLQQKGIQFDQLPEDKTWLWREARLKDPDGNQLILYFAGENRIDPPWRVNPDETA
ncbi:MAG: VOC family protein [Candidatus Cyclobacteriaceae bacterium M3_2C_046]